VSQDVDPLFLAFQLAVAGRYSIDRELGRGGMGIVFLAREVHLDRLVAIKVLPPERAAQESLRERFMREARLAAKLSHPNIIPIHSVEETGDFVFFVMAFIDGETLAQRVRARGPLSPSEGTRVLREVAWALAYAHAQGLVHRDVKPDNILLETSSGRVMVADFGIAAAAGDEESSGVSGTPEFMSPEQALAKPIDARSDLYGLGATAFFAFSGKLPFEGKTATEILAKHVTEQPPTLTSLGLTVPRKVALLVDRCLAKEPEHRPASSQAVAEQLASALEQRRELPAALRAFVKRTSRLNGGGTVVAGIALLPLSVYMSYLFGNVGGFGTFILGLTAAPFGYFVWAARKISLQGFAHRDIEPGFKAEIELSREELSVGQQQRGSLGIEKWVRLGFKISGITFLVAGATWLTMGLTPIPRAILGLWEMVGFTAAVAGNLATYTGIGLVALMQRHRDIDSEFWSKLWMGRIGKSAFAFARKLLGNRVTKVAMTHRATELSLGLAAEQLYDGLPAETRAQLGDLPTVLQRLQDDAQSLRKHYDGLQEALADAGDAATSTQYAEVRATRDAIHAKLGETVGALETIRLNLLKLHAGSATVEGLTTHLSIAAEVSEEVSRLISAYSDIKREIHLPRHPAVTPV
jgi:eukaryotic-like serine/threonine-protein kinase